MESFLRLSNLVGYIMVQNCEFHKYEGISALRYILNSGYECKFIAM